MGSRCGGGCVLCCTILYVPSRKRRLSVPRTEKSRKSWPLALRLSTNAGLARVKTSFAKTGSTSKPGMTLRPAPSFVASAVALHGHAALPFAISSFAVRLKRPKTRETSRHSRQGRYWGQSASRSHSSRGGEGRADSDDMCSANSRQAGI
jgi:hypothetical protein